MHEPLLNLVSAAFALAVVSLTVCVYCLFRVLMVERAIYRARKRQHKLREKRALRNYERRALRHE
jgi:hypothetical protein